MEKKLHPAIIDKYFQLRGADIGNLRRNDELAWSAAHLLNHWYGTKIYDRARVQHSTEIRQGVVELVAKLRKHPDIIKVLQHQKEEEQRRFAAYQEREKKRRELYREQQKQMEEAEKRRLALCDKTKTNALSKWWCRRGWFVDTAQQSHPRRTPPGTHPRKKKW